MTTKTKKSKVDLAQELGIVEEQEQEVSSHLQKLLNRKQRNRQQSFDDWRSLIEAYISKEYVPDNLAQEVFDQINTNHREFDGMNALMSDARQLQQYRRGQQHKKIDQLAAFIERHGDRPSLVVRLQALKTEAAEVKHLLREYDSTAHVHRYTADMSDHIAVSNHRLFPNT